MNVNRYELKNIEKQKRTSKAFSDSPLLSSFLGVINNIIEIGSNMKSIEMAMFTNPMQCWIDNRNKKKKAKKCLPGTIIEVEFGLPYKTETPYRHSALVIKEYQNKVLVIPSTSRKEFLDIAYHPVDNPSGDKYFRKVGKHDNFDHDCVLAINDLKIVSKNRILSTCGTIDTLSGNSLYKEIRRTILEDIFNEEIEEYELKVTELDQIIESYKETVYNKKNIIDALYKKIERKNNIIKNLKKQKRG